ncbi:MAG: TlpA family protein disulfide reductase, partial [Muribaculaceae bacterium]|nr:TlpA family protein disulfide reductase [Muribaculaceae bacterium]
MKQVLLIGAVLICAACAPTPPPTAEEILAETLENVRNVHTARYNLTQHIFYTPDDSLYISEENYRIVECENPADTLGLTEFVWLNEKTRLQVAISPEYLYFDRPGYIEKMRRSADGSSWVPFYNRVMRMCEYLLQPADNITLTVIDRGDEWEIDAPVHGGKMVYFAGYPRVLEMSPDDIGSHFGLRVDKSTMMPVWVSYLSNLPQNRYEWSISDVEINPFAPETFSASDYLGDVPVYDEDESDKKYREWRQEHITNILNAPLPTDTLTLLDGTQVSLNDGTDRARVIVFTTTQCGVSLTAIPSINRIYESHPADSVQMFGVTRENVAQPRAVLDALKKNDFRVPVALNNGRFYEYFYPEGLAPAVIVVGRNGKIALVQSG